MPVADVRPITSETIQLAISAANGTIAITLDAEVAAGPKPRNSAGKPPPDLH